MSIMIAVRQCFHCSGSGKVTRGLLNVLEKCHVCNEVGQVTAPQNAEPCATCHGSCFCERPFFDVLWSATPRGRAPGLESKRCTACNGEGYPGRHELYPNEEGVPAKPVLPPDQRTEYSCESCGEHIVSRRDGCPRCTAKCIICNFNPPSIGSRECAMCAIQATLDERYKQTHPYPCALCGTESIGSTNVEFCDTCTERIREYPCPCFACKKVFAVRTNADMCFDCRTVHTPYTCMRCMDVCRTREPNQRCDVCEKHVRKYPHSCVRCGAAHLFQQEGFSCDACKQRYPYPCARCARPHTGATKNDFCTSCSVHVLLFPNACARCGSTYTVEKKDWRCDPCERYVREHPHPCARCGTANEAQTEDTWCTACERHVQEHPHPCVRCGKANMTVRAGTRCTACNHYMQEHPHPCIRCGTKHLFADAGHSCDTCKERYPHPCIRCAALNSTQREGAHCAPCTVHMRRYPHTCTRCKTPYATKHRCTWCGSCEKKHEESVAFWITGAIICGITLAIIAALTAVIMNENPKMHFFNALFGASALVVLSAVTITMWISDRR